MVLLNWPKKCPECNSSRIVTTSVTFKCNRCGYAADLRERPLEFRTYKKKEETTSQETIVEKPNGST